MALTPPPKRFPLTPEQRLNWLRLIRSENVGPATFSDLINHFGTASAALDAIPDLAKRGGAVARIEICSVDTAKQELETCHQVGGRFIGMGEPDYPENLRALDSCPPLICLKGAVKAIKPKSISIVGARNASAAGLKLTTRFATGLGEVGYIIVSGLARGIDTFAHKSTIETGTVAVFAGGIDHIYPAENASLAHEIIEANGAIVSEMPMGWRPRSQDFPRRNRIVVGLSLAVLVIEAARRSGSLISARLCNEAGRLVFAVPGSPLDPRSEGTNHLIRQGAILTRTVDDMLEDLQPLDQKAIPLEEPDGIGFHKDADEGGEDQLIDIPNDRRQRIISALGPSPIEVDDILRFCDVSPGELQLVLVELALAGRLERHGGNRISLIH